MKIIWGWCYRVKWWNHVCNVSDNKSLPRLEIQYVRRAYSGVGAGKYQELHLFIAI